MQRYDRWDWRGSWASTGSNQGGWLSFLGKHVDLSCSHCMDIFMWKVIFNTMCIFVGFWIFLVVCRRKLGTTTLSIQSSILPNCLSWKIDQPWALGWPILSHVFHRLPRWFDHVSGLAERADTAEGGVGDDGGQNKPWSHQKIRGNHLGMILKHHFHGNIGDIWGWLMVIYRQKLIPTCWILKIQRVPSWQIHGKMNGT